MSTLGALGTLRGYHEFIRRYHECIKVAQYTKGYCKYIAGFPVHCRDVMIYVGDAMIHVGEYHDSSGKMRQFRCGLSSVDQGMFSASEVLINKKNVFCQ